MRSALVFAFLVLGVSSLVFGVDELPVTDLAAQADAAPLDRQPELYLKLAERQMKQADHLYSDGKVDEAAAAVRDVSAYSEKAAKAAVTTGKRLKNIEISIRKMSARLRDIQRTLSFDDQAPVKAAIEHLEDLRTQLLTRMFSKEKKK